MVDNQLSDLTKMFIIKDSWLQSQERRRRRKEDIFRFVSQRVLVVAIFGGIGYVTYLNSLDYVYSLGVYSAACTLYILIKK